MVLNRNDKASPIRHNRLSHTTLGGHRSARRSRSTLPHTYHPAPIHTLGINGRLLICQKSAALPRPSPRLGVPRTAKRTDLSPRLANPVLGRAFGQKWCRKDKRFPFRFARPSNLRRRPDCHPNSKHTRTTFPAHQVRWEGAACEDVPAQARPNQRHDSGATISRFCHWNRSK